MSAIHKIAPVRMVEYRVIVDGFTIDKIKLPTPTTQAQRDIARHEFARENGIPCHYIRLRKVSSCRT